MQRSPRRWPSLTWRASRRPRLMHLECHSSKFEASSRSMIHLRKNAASGSLASLSCNPRSSSAHKEELQRRCNMDARLAIWSATTTSRSRQAVSRVSTMASLVRSCSKRAAWIPSACWCWSHSLRWSLRTMKSHGMSSTSHHQLCKEHATLTSSTRTASNSRPQLSMRPRTRQLLLTSTGRDSCFLSNCSVTARV